MGLSGRYQSYAIAPQQFGEKARMLAAEGAQIVYVVDSAGGMFPRQVARYFDEVRTRTDVKMGLHAHNNLLLAVANSLEAIGHGATFIDCTLYGLGRSAGNAPTEVLVATLENLGYETGIDLFKVMNIAEAYMKPLINQVQLYDMMAVTAGYSLFHSSYLPKVAEEPPLKIDFHARWRAHGAHEHLSHKPIGIGDGVR